jgi:hypothetical protein
MMQKIESLFKDRISEKKFRDLSTTTLFLADIANILYIDRVFLSSSKISGMMQNSLRLAGYSPGDIPAELLQEAQGAFISTFWIFLMIFMINNSVFYTLYHRGKKAGIKYVKGYAFFGFALTLINCFTPNTESSLWMLVLILSTIVYLYIFLGTRFFYRKPIQ